MKRINNLYKNLTNINNIIHIYEKQIRVNTKNKFKIEKYENYLSVNFYKIYDELIKENVSFSKYFIFLIKEPKCRIIMSQTIKDKIINHLVAKYILIESFEKSFIDSNVATRKNKGTLYAIALKKHK